MARRRPAITARPSEAFLSHASRDRPFAEKIVGVLQRHGVPVWYAPSNILGAQQWHDEIGRALQRCDWFLVILTGNVLKREWVKRELIYALSQPRYNNRILCLKRQDGDFTALSWVLPSLQHVDFTGDFARGCRDLLRTWGIGYDPG